MIKREILFIDDDSMTLFINEQLISDETTIPVRCFTSAQKGLDYIFGHNDGTEIMLFLDLNMPEMNGWEVLDVLSSSKFNVSLRVFILSSSVDERDEDRAKDYPMVENFLRKPLDVSKARVLWGAS